MEIRGLLFALFHSSFALALVARAPQDADSTVYEGSFVVFTTTVVATFTVGADREVLAATSSDSTTPCTTTTTYDETTITTLPGKGKLTSSATPTTTKAPTSSVQDASSSSSTPQGNGEDDTNAYGNFDEFKSAIMNSTNHYRWMFGANPVTWSDDLATNASHNAQQCVFQHTTNNADGENIAAGYSSPQSTVEAWGDEYKQYTSGYTDPTGHFTQMVWKATTEVGCWATWCDNQGKIEQQWYVVCEYKPAGNVISPDFANNVGGLVHSVLGARDTAAAPTSEFVTVVTSIAAAITTGLL